MSAKIYGNPFAPRAPEGQPDIKIQMTCGCCGKVNDVVMTWEGARQFAANLEHRIAEAMRDVPRTEGPFFGDRA